ncbi:transposase [Streptomyces sp. NBC_00057]
MPIVQYWGKGLLASVDGLRFVVPGAESAGGYGPLEALARNKGRTSSAHSAWS